MSDAKAVEEQSRDDRVLRLSLALTELAQRLWEAGDGLPQAFEAITTAAAQVLDVSSVCIWQDQADGSRLCTHAYDLVSDLHNGPGVLDRLTLNDERTTVDAFPRPHMRARMLSLVQTDSTQPSAMPAHLQRASQEQCLLERPISLEGRHYGAVVFTAMDPARQWQPDEIAFAGQMGDFLARAVQNERHRRAEVRLDYLDLHDALTGLANRTLLLATIDDLLRRQRKRPRLAALLFISLDHFYSVNEIAGEVGGDLILKELGERITEVIHDEDVTSRVESDCFAVLIPWLTHSWQAHQRAEDILTALSKPLELGEFAFTVSASIGIAFSEQANATTADVLLRDADLASKQALQLGRNRCEVFDSAQHRGLLDRLATERSLRDALQDDALELVYQPEISLDTGKVVAAEALLRWRDPDGQLRAATDFIDVAETSGLIVPIGRWVLGRACRDANQWPLASDGQACSLAVNLSARQFEQPGLVEMVAEVLRETAFAPQRLCLEITETSLMVHAQSALETLCALKALGISLAVDDFGTGYSSLAYLKRFPVDMLKIDKSLIDGLPEDAHAHAIVSAVVALASAMALQVVVEGVEHLAQETVLRAMGCHRVQGWLHARGEPQADLIRRLQAQGGGMVRQTPTVQSFSPSPLDQPLGEP